MKSYFDLHSLVELQGPSLKWGGPPRVRPRNVRAPLKRGAPRRVQDGGPGRGALGLNERVLAGSHTVRSYVENR
jgi:hypothetical protein